MKILEAEERDIEIVEARSEVEPLVEFLGRTRVYRVGEFHAYIEPDVEISPEKVGVIKILNISAHTPQPGLKLLRLSGVAFKSASELEKYLEWLREASMRDHRVLGRRLDLFGFYEEAGQGLVIYHPRGQIIREELIGLIREVNERLGYREVYTPHVYRAFLWKISGHYDLYKDKMVLAEIGGEEYGIKPMNCPGHILIYKSKPRSYRDLPVKLSEFGTVYRWEKRGELYGLLRLRGFTQDDGHAFLREDQVGEEVKNIIVEVMGVLKIFGFSGEDIKIYVSTRPEEYIGTEEMWEKATKVLMESLEELGLPYEVKEGEGAFYGPKIDIYFRDSLGRWWQCSTIQVDFALPERFDLTYVDRDGSKKRPVMIHRALLGSIERFMAIILENFSGRLPTWISPIQARVIPVSGDIIPYAEKVVGYLRSNGIRVDTDFGEETLSKRIKRAYDEAIPYIVLVGRREAENNTVTIRGRGNIQVKDMPLEKFTKILLEEVRKRSLTQIVAEKS